MTEASVSLLHHGLQVHEFVQPVRPQFAAVARAFDAAERRRGGARDRKSVVSGKSVSVRVVLGGRRCIKTKKITDNDEHKQLTTLNTITYNHSKQSKYQS